MEPPGTAPGSEPIITGAFIAIVGVAPDTANIGGQGGVCKVEGRVRTVEGAGRVIRLGGGRGVRQAAVQVWSTFAMKR